MRPADARGAGARARQRWQGVGVLGVSGVAVVLFVASLWLPNAGGSAEAGSTAALRVSAPVQNASATTGAPLVELPSVPLTEQVAPVPGLVFTIGRVRPVDVIDPASGDSGSPALRFAVILRNDTDAPVSLASTAVHLFAGAHHQPMSALTGVRGETLPEWVGAGATVTGLYLFSVPADDRTTAKVVVDYAVGAPRVVFAGTVQH